MVCVSSGHNYLRVTAGLNYLRVTSEMTTLTVQVLPVHDTRPEIEVIGDKMTWMAFHDYFLNDLPQALRIEEVLDQTQEELREGMSCVYNNNACLV